MYAPVGWSASGRPVRRAPWRSRRRMRPSARRPRTQASATRPAGLSGGLPGGRLAELGAGRSTVGSWTFPPSCTRSPSRPAPTFTVIARGEGALVWDADGQRVRRRHGQPVVLRRRPRPRRDRRRRRRPAAHDRRLLVLRAVLQRAGRRARRALVELDADPRRPGVLLRLRLGGRRHGDEAGPPGPGPGRAPGADARSSAAARGYHGATSAAPAPRASPLNRDGWGPLVPDVVQVPSDDTEALAAADGRARRRDRRRHHRAGAGRRRRASRPPTATSTGCAGCATSTARSSSSTR